MQFPCAFRRTDHVIATLNNGCRNVLYWLCIVENVGIFYENSIDEIMAFYSSESYCKVKIFCLFEVFWIREQSTCRHLPTRPFLRCSTSNFDVFTRQALVIGRNESRLLIHWNVLLIRFKGIGKDMACSILIEPMQFRTSTHEDTSKNKRTYSFRMFDSVNEREC
ncbi:MAG: Uncharacterised protein [Euryarchaeota archaeon UBA443]|nr:MAG: Uncharacterised protein [Euryarchaeota archaeon UBA443]